MAEPRQPVVSLMDRMNDDPELLAIQDEADLATPNGMSSASDIMPDGIEIELDTTPTKRLVRTGKTRIPKV